MSKMNEKEKLKKPPLYRFAAFILMLFPYIFLYAGIQVIASFAVEIMEDLTIKKQVFRFCLPWEPCLWQLHPQQQGD